MVESKHTPPLLKIPLEVRELIYKEALCSSWSSSHLLRTCKEIYSEAQKYLYQRPITFGSQAALFHWLNTTPERYRHVVTNITFALQDVDLKPLLSPSKGDDLAPMPRLRAWEIYEIGLEELQESLEKLPNVRNMTIEALPGRQSHLYQDFLAKLLESLGRVYPGLHALSLEGNFHHQGLEFLSVLPGLRSLSFDGFSATSSSEAADILSSLSQLTTLSLVSQQTMLTPIEHRHSSFTSTRQSFTDEVARQMTQITSFSFVEDRFYEAYPSLFFTSMVLTSLHNHSNLNSLSIILAYPPNTETLKALETSLEVSSVETLELDWPGLDLDTLGGHSLLPPKLKDFWVRAASVAVAFDITFLIHESRDAGDLTELRRLVLIRDTWSGDMGEGNRRLGNDHGDGSEVGEIASTDEDDELENNGRDEDDPLPNATDDDNFARTKKLLERLGVRVCWYTEHNRVRF
ncbi:hypothetical protein CC78DRAFT_545791 [Lojkania enalia]|uniref:Uncharacterized protein n=1 Tax=Lojkania enalia TaxID=147567 RepID=A0A9P4N2D2_9PLEO|nr:hypothetical protein CC78DRAFT_545791 [Didymosphaeria enalia]